MSEIEWRPVVGFDNYEISNTGLVKRVKPGKNTEVGKILKPIENSRGYFVFAVCQNKTSKLLRLHREIALAFLGPPPTPRHQAAHNDGNKANNLLENIRWVTPKENWDDRKKHGTDIVGEKHPRTHLKEEDILEIRKRKFLGEFCKDIARDFNININTVSAIVTRKNWSHIP